MQVSLLSEFESRRSHQKKRPTGRFFCGSFCVTFLLTYHLPGSRMSLAEKNYGDGEIVIFLNWAAVF